MKNIIKYGLLSLVAAAGVSCESFLNEKVVSGVSYDYLETKTGIETAVNAFIRLCAGMSVASVIIA